MSKILIVDDEVNIRKVVREYAEFEGYEVSEAENGMEAVSICKENDFDIIIMDVMMPRLDGYSAVKEIHKYKQIPVIMLSSAGTSQKLKETLELGALDFIQKPYTSDQIKQAVERIRRKVEENKDG